MLYIICIYIFILLPENRRLGQRWVRLSASARLRCWFWAQRLEWLGWAQTTPLRQKWLRQLRWVFWSPLHGCTNRKRHAFGKFRFCIFRSVDVWGSFLKCFKQEIDKGSSHQSGLLRTYLRCKNGGGMGGVGGALWGKYVLWTHPLLLRNSYQIWRFLKRQDHQESCETKNEVCSFSIHDKSVQGTVWADALQRKDSDAAFECSWRWKPDEKLQVANVLWSFLRFVHIWFAENVTSENSVKFEENPNKAWFEFVNRMHERMLSTTTQGEKGAQHESTSGLGCSWNISFFIFLALAPSLQFWVQTLLIR